MNFKVKKANLIDDIILLLLILDIMIFKWLGLQSLVNDVVTIFLIIDIILNLEDFFESYSFITILSVLLYAFINFLLFPGSINLFLRNIYRVIRAILLFDYIARLTLKKPNYVIAKMKSFFIPINAYLLINIPVLLLQRMGFIRLAAFDMSNAQSTLVFDYYSGLFGLYGTPCLAIYTCFVFVYNITYMRLFANKKTVLTIRLFNIFQLVFFLVFSIINDNKFYYIEIFMYSLILYICINRPEEIRGMTIKGKTHRKYKLWLRIGVITGLMIASIYTLYNNISAVKNIVDLFIRKINQGLDYKNVVGGGERIGIILYMLNSQNKYWGFGFARLKIEEYTLGFRHFGQGDIGTFMAFGGCIFIFLVMICLYVNINRPYNKNLVPILFLVSYTVMGVYTNAFSNMSTLASIVLLYMTFWVASHPIKKSYNK